MYTPATVDDREAKRTALAASVALLAFGALTAFALVGWFYLNPSPWNWKSILAVVCAVLAVAASALVWRSPARGPAVIGIAAMLASLARVGMPGEWNWRSLALIAITFVLLMPIVHAAIVLRKGW